MGSTGSTSLELNDFVLTATGCPAHKTALFVYGANPVQVPLGNGFRCVGVERTNRVERRCARRHVETSAVHEHTKGMTH